MIIDVYNSTKPEDVARELFQMEIHPRTIKVYNNGNSSLIEIIYDGNFATVYGSIEPGRYQLKQNGSECILESVK
ncbi:MAG: hypothetical protein QXM68_04310 [Candidatus Aenigmatarchaeota archaeon]|nr:hypothetical protein [Candidatus Aenigmarchaeota archaeon]